MFINWCADLGPIITREMDGITVHHGTLSETLARAFRTETRAGRIAWTITLTAGAAYLWRHIATFQYSHKGAAHDGRHRPAT